MKNTKSTMIGCLLVLAVAFVAVESLATFAVFAQSPAPTVTAAPTHTSTPVPTPTEIASEKILGLYSEAIEISNRTIKTVEWGMTVVLVVITIIVGIVGGFTVYRGKVAEDKASEADAKASANQRLLDRIEERARKAEDTVQELGFKVKRLDNDIRATENALQSTIQDALLAKENADKAQTQMGAVIKEFDTLQRQAKEIQGSIGVFDEGDWHFLATLRLIDKHRTNLFPAGDSQKRQQAEWAILEKTHSDSPLVRRESLIALSELREPSEATIERFNEIVAREEDPGIKELAEETVRRWASTADSQVEVEN